MYLVDPFSTVSVFCSTQGGGPEPHGGLEPHGGPPGLPDPNGPPLQGLFEFPSVGAAPGAPLLVDPEPCVGVGSDIVLSECSTVAERKKE